MSDDRHLSEDERHTGSDALPDIDTFGLGVPDSALRAYGPEDVELPDAGSVADQTRHSGDACFVAVVVEALDAGVDVETTAGGVESVLGSDGGGERQRRDGKLG